MIYYKKYIHLLYQLQKLLEDKQKQFFKLQKDIEKPLFGKGDPFYSIDTFICISISEILQPINDLLREEK